jgi:hypothetical protein
LPVAPVNHASQTDSGNRRAAGVPYRDPRDVAHNPRKEPMKTEAESAAEINRAYARVTARPRAYLERVEEAARRLLIARDTDPRPHTWRQAEAELRDALGMPQPVTPLVKPWRQ